MVDSEKNNSVLLKELDSLRNLNEELRAQLAQKERELQRRQVEEELREAELEARGWERHAAVVQEIYVAQRERDQAMMARLRLANEERDEALLHAIRLQQPSELENINPEESDLLSQDLQDLLRGVCGAGSGQAVERTGSVLVTWLQQARQHRVKITAQEMKAVIEERDRSAAKCKRLEQDLSEVKQRNPNTATSKDLSVLPVDLERPQRERDQALEHLRRLEDQLHNYYSLHQSWQTTLGSQPPLPDDRASPPDTALQQFPFLLQFQQLCREHHNILTELHQAQQAEREAREKINRLERLVEVLRKKVGTGSIRAII